MKASVIIFTYNQEKTVGRAIESVLRQECEDPWEIVLSDDCSTDGTRVICEEYAARYPERIRLMPKVGNRGLVGNYFDAFEFARGEYISDCAGDDEWVDPSRLQRQIEVLEANPDVSVCYSDVEVAEEGKPPYLHSSDPIRNKYFRGRVKGRDLLIATLNHTKSLPYTLSAALYRKAPVEALYRASRKMIRNEESGVEDVPLLAAISSAGDGVWLPVIASRYHIYGESVSNNLDYEKEYRFYSRILRLIPRLARFYGIDLKELKNHYRDKITHISAQARHSRRRELIDDTKDIAKLWRVPLPLKARLNLLLGRLLSK